MQRQSKSVKSRVLATASVAALAMATTAGLGAPALAQEEEAAERIVVTGSRIVRRDFEANSPIVTIESDTFENRSSFNVEAALNQLPQFTPDGSQNLASGAATPFPRGDSAPGAATLNLRGLGSNRSLVLVNGRRPQPVNAQLVVDVNTIPAAAIENVEVITGGAAAVYGADAIAGVVNFRLRDDFEGLEVDAQYGISERDDNEETSFSALIGGNFADGRGNAMLGAMWSERGEAFQRERDFYTRGWLDPATDGGSVNNAVPGVTTSAIDVDGFFGPAPSITYGVNTNGSLFNVNAANNPAAPFLGSLNAQGDGAGYKINDDGVLQYNDPNAQLSIPSRRYSVFAAAHYDITDSLTAFLEANYMENSTSARSLVPPAFNIWTISIPYNPANDDPDSPTFGANQQNFHPVSAAFADLLNSRVNTPPPGVPGGPTSAAATPWSMTRALDFLGRLRTDTTSNIYQVTGGLEGEFPFSQWTQDRDWTWEVYGSHGRTSVVAQQPEGSISQINLQQMISGVATGPLVGGLPSFGGALSPSPTYRAQGPWGRGWNNGGELATVAGCTTGIPIFNPNGSVPDVVEVSQDCIDYATLRRNDLTTLEQNIVEATMQGGLVDVPWGAGEVRFALGATYRDADFAYNPDSAFAATQQRANVINIINLPLYTEGYLSVEEVYGELLVPLLADVPLVQNLELELGIRRSDYNTAGEIDTYKMLADWTATDWLRFRGGYQRANRAPNIFELFAPISSGLVFGTNDPCTNITSLDGGPNFTAAYGNRPDNANRTNVQLACSELIARDGGFRYATADDRPSTGPNDLTHMDNFRWTVVGYDVPFPISIALAQGNEDLESEVADTWTFGTVINSPFQHPLLDRLSLSIDWYQIEIEGTIATPGYGVVYSQCLDPQFNPLIGSTAGSLTGAEILAGSPYCDLINREPVDINGTLGAVGSGLDRNFDATYTNLGGTETAGIDVQLNWGAEFEDMGLSAIPGGLNVNLVANFLKEYSEAPFPGANSVDYTGTVFAGGKYDFKAFSTIGYNVGPATVGARMRFLSPISPLATATVGSAKTASHSEVDLFGRWMLNETVELRGGVDNVADEQPEVVGATPSNASLNTTNQNYDVLGRRFYVGATLRY